MTDLEILTVCADAAGEAVYEYNGYLFFKGPRYNAQQHSEHYNPLKYDEQAMRLMKRIGVTCMWSKDGWQASFAEHGAEVCKSFAMNLDLNRAICECVANMSKP